MALNVYLNSMSASQPPNFTFTKTWTSEKVSILTIDGRTMVGTLLSCDSSMNLVLQDTVERIIRPRDEGEPSEEVPLGVYIVRGDNVAICGRVDEEIDNQINWEKVHGEAIGTTKHI